MKHKKLTSKCGITIPKDIRHSAGLMAGQAVDLLETEDGVLIRKHMPTCNICGSPDGVIAFKGFEICAACRTELANAEVME